MLSLRSPDCQSFIGYRFWGIRGSIAFCPSEYRVSSIDRRSLQVVSLLVESDGRGRSRLPALHAAAKKDDVKAAALLLQQTGQSPDETSKSGFTAMHIAAHYGNQKVAALLIQNGADVRLAAKVNFKIVFRKYY